jgi:formamidopyrimidine-DNA glycosylase
MPELAEVEFYRKEWNAGLSGRVKAVVLHEAVRLFRRCDVAALVVGLTGADLVASETHGKRLLFRFRRSAVELLWLGIHLGMTGKLFRAEPDYRTGKHDHLVLVQGENTLVFNDSRQFGRVDFAQGHEVPEWWRDLPPPVLSRRFTLIHMGAYLNRHRRSPIKGVLLMQDGFPGLGNWMVDEILWQSAIHPARLAGDLNREELGEIHRAIRSVSTTAMKTIGRDFRDPPAGWLFHERWKRGGFCPQTGVALRYDTIAGRTSCWSPGVQGEPASG